MSRTIIAASVLMAGIFGSLAQLQAQNPTVSLSSYYGRLDIRTFASHDDVYVYETRSSSYYNWATGEYRPAGTNINVWITDSTGKWMAWRSFPKRDVRLILIRTGDGDDFVQVTTNISAHIYGEDGDDELHGGDGNDSIDAGNADDNDEIYGHGGNDLLKGGKSGYLFGPTYWDRLFAPDTHMYGGTGTDTYVYREDIDAFIDEPWDSLLDDIDPDFTSWDGISRWTEPRTQLSYR